MTYQEKNIIVSLTATILVFSIFFARLSGMCQDGLFDGPDGLRLIGKSILILMAANVAATVILTIVFNIVFAIATGDPKPSFVVDERDKQFELRGLQTMLYVTGAGFLLAMIALTAGWAAYQVFLVIIISFALGDVTGNLVRLFLYRRGY